MQSLPHFEGKDGADCNHSTHHLVFHQTLNSHRRRKRVKSNDNVTGAELLYQMIMLPEPNCSIK